MRKILLNIINQRRADFAGQQPAPGNERFPENNHVAAQNGLRLADGPAHFSRKNNVQDRPTRHQGHDKNYNRSYFFSFQFCPRWGGLDRFNKDFNKVSQGPRGPWALKLILLPLRLPLRLPTALSRNPSPTRPS